MVSSHISLPKPKESRSPPSFEPGKIYLYLSADGITRQRCGRHIHRERWGQPVRIWHIERPSDRRTCIECVYEKFQQTRVKGEKR